MKKLVLALATVLALLAVSLGGAAASGKQAGGGPHAAPCCSYVTYKYIRNDLEPPEPRGSQNTTGCVWDADDGWRDDPVFPAHADVYLAAGASATDSMCVVANDREVFVTVELYSDSPGLTLTVCFPGIANRCLDFSTAHPVQLGKRVPGYELYGCFGILYDTGDPEMQVIPGTNGGYGLQTQAVFTLANPTAARAVLYERDAAARYRSSFGIQGIVNFGQTYPIAYHCQADEFDDRPFYWHH